MWNRSLILFTGTLPENPLSGSLLFETSGLEISLALNGNEIWDTAFANRLAFPAGAAARSFVLVFGLFLLGLLQKKPDFSLLPLLAALLGLISFRLIQEQGYYFLPEPVSHLLGHPRIGLFILAALLSLAFAFWFHFFWEANLPI